MSLSFQPLQPVCVRDPRTMVAGPKMYAVLKSGSQMTSKQYSTTSISTSSLQFSCPPPSGGIFIDRNVRLYLPVRLTFTGTPALGTTLLRSGFDAPRAFGLSSSIETLQATINNQGVSINLADTIQPLMWFNTGTELKNSDYSTTPCYQDQSQSYDDLVGSNRNPLGDYSVTGDNVPAPRGAFPFVIVANPVGDGVNPVTAVVDVAFNESFYLSPFWWGKGVSSEAFFNVTTMDFNITFLQQAANRFWSHSGALGGVANFATAAYVIGGLTGGPTSFSLTTGNVPFVLFNYITPQETQVLSPNMAISYPYFDVQRYATTQSLINPGVSATMISNNIQLNSIPRRMYIFARKRNNDLYASASNTDTYLSIENISIQFQNKNGLLASASKQQLYEMSVKNHCTMSWNQWNGRVPPIGNFGGAQVGTVGSILAIEFGTDIGLDSLDAPGKLVQAQLQVQVVATNVSNAAITPELYIITVLEGVFTIEGLGRASTRIGVISSQDILDCQARPSLNYKDIQEVNGGDFFSTIKEGLSNLGNSLWKGITEGKALSTIGSVLGSLPIPIVSDVARVATPVLKTIGLGDGEGVRAGVVAGARRRMRGRGAIAGGEGEGEGGGVMTRAELAEKLRY